MSVALQLDPLMTYLAVAFGGGDSGDNNLSDFARCRLCCRRLIQMMRDVAACLLTSVVPKLFEVVTFFEVWLGVHRPAVVKPCRSSIAQQRSVNGDKF